MDPSNLLLTAVLGTSSKEEVMETNSVFFCMEEWICFHCPIITSYLGVSE
jgi:hypothetical protein